MDLSILGMTEMEFKVYRALLKCGASTIPLIAKNSHLNERSAYDCIERLISKGIVGQIMQNNKRMFLALNPEMLSFAIEEHENKINKEFQEINAILAASQNKLNVHLIPSKAAFLKILKTVVVDTVFLCLGAEELLNYPSFKFLLSSSNPTINKITFSEASVVVLFSKELFLIYSVPEEKGFYFNDSEFVKNIKVYFK